MGITCGSGLRLISGPRSWPTSRRLPLLILLPALLLCFSSRLATAEPLMTIAKDTLIGGATGLILGGTLTLVVDDQDRSEVVRWGVVIGTFGGFGFGVWRATRGEGEDLFGDASAPRMTPAGLGGQASGAAQAWADHRRAIAADDPAAREPERSDPAGGWSVRIPLLRYDW